MPSGSRDARKAASRSGPLRESASGSASTLFDRRWSASRPVSSPNVGDELDLGPPPQHSFALLPSPGRSDPAVVQRKQTKKVDDDYIQKLLAEVDNEQLRGQLQYTWDTIKKLDGEAFFDDEIGAAFGGYDPLKKKLVLRIPEQNFWQWPDTTLEKKAIAIHELTHVAEILANTGGMQNVDVDDMKTRKVMETDMAAVGEILEALISKIDEEKVALRAVSFDSSTGMEKNLYGYLLERAGYSYQALTNAKSNFEFPTVVNQMVFVMEAKAEANETLKTTATYKGLKKLEALLVASRNTRFRKARGKERFGKVD